MLILSEKAMVSSVDLVAMMDKIEKAMVFAGNGEFAMPLRTNVEFGKDKDSLMLMPCLTADTWGCKLLTLRPSNPPKGLPFINGAVMLFNSNTGTPEALLEGKTVTALRTGAVGGVGIRNTAKPDIRSLGLVGAGMQGYWQARYGCAARNTVKEVWVYDAFSNKLPEFVDRLQSVLPGINVKIAKDPVELLEKTQAVMTATTTKTPLFPEDEELLRGHAFSGIGSYLPDMKEFPDALFKVTGSHVYVDTLHALEETGDIIHPLKSGVLKRENIHTYADRISGKCGKEWPETSLCKSVGMALFDVVAAELLCTLAKESGQGVEIEF